MDATSVQDQLPLLRPTAGLDAFLVLMRRTALRVLLRIQTRRQQRLRPPEPRSPPPRKSRFIEHLPENGYFDTEADKPESSRANPLPVIDREEVPGSSTIDVDSPHVMSVNSEYSGETDTQLERQEREAEEAERATKARFEQVQKEAAEKYQKAKRAASQKEKEGKERTKDFGRVLDENKNNPVVIANATVLGIGAVALGLGAYRKYTANELSWKVAGLWAGIVGVFAVGDFYTSQWFFKNKYPRK